MLRLQDQYLLISSVLAAGLYVKIPWSLLLSWLFANVLFSCTSFMLNELVDRQDVDKYSWNKIHIKKGEKFDNKIVITIFIVLSFLGLYLAFISRLLWWGLGIYILELLYSLKPIRLKSRFFLDMLVQLLAWFIVPYLAPIWLYGRAFEILPKIFPAACILWALIFSYQLADYPGDVKGGLKGTHVVLGMKNSLILGLVLGLLGTVLFFVQKIYLVAPWAWLMVGIAIFDCVLYLRWLGMKTLDNQVKSMQTFVHILKSIGYLAVPYLLVWYFV